MAALATIAVAVCFMACTKGLGVENPNISNWEDDLCHDEIILGEQLENPYTVANVKNALDVLYPGTKASSSINATDLYVRFLPRSEEDLETLKNLGVSLLDHPMDYSVVRDGDYYHDPEIERDCITWQYGVVPVGFEFPAEIEHELLDECYLAENDPSTKSSVGIDWEAVERKSFDLTGNSGMLCEQTKGGGTEPSGRITIVDSNANGGQPFGVAGVKVQCNVFIKFASAFTDTDGYYKIPKKFTANPRFRLVFENSKGFTIGFNTILYKGSISTLGKHSSQGATVNVSSNSERKLFRRCCVNNAAWEYYEKCSPGNYNIASPPSNLCFWCFDDLDVSSSVMLHHGTIMGGNSTNTIYQLVAWIVQIFGPDITLGTKNLLTYDQIFATVVHEMAHASHFTKVGLEYWNTYIGYIVSCALAGQDTYGDGTLNNAGHCAVGEMWAYYMENKLYKDRYGRNPGAGNSYWFHPQILTALQDRGLSVYQLFAAFTPIVTDKRKLQDEYMGLYPTKRSVITQIFNRYD